eukprot:g14129.t1
MPSTTRFFGSYTGIVRTLVFKKQFGFIEPRDYTAKDGKDLMFTFFNIKDRRIAEVGDEVTFEVRENPVKPGREEAFDVEGGTGRAWEARNPRTAGRGSGGTGGEEAAAAAVDGGGGGGRADGKSASSSDGGVAGTKTGAEAETSSTGASTAAASASA